MAGNYEQVQHRDPGVLLLPSFQNTSRAEDEDVCRTWLRIETEAEKWSSVRNSLLT